MSNSVKKTPIFTYTGHSNKRSKKECNQKFRQISRIAILKEKMCPVRLDEVMTEYEFRGDGKYYLKSPKKKYMRK